MAFNSETGMLSCPACGREDQVEDFPKDFISAEFSEDEANEYHCENCGAVLITDKDTAATKCSFCGAGVVLAARLSGILAPQKVIPFTISKEKAIEAFKKWCRRGLLTPRGFMSANRIKDITGIYVPFWLYDLNSKVEVRGTGTRVRQYTKGDYIYTETSYFDIYRKMDLNYVKIPVDASEKMNDELMDKLEPFPYDQLKNFNFPYLAGYIAEKYQYDEQELLPRAKYKVSDFIESFIQSTVNGYNTVNFRSKQIDTKKVRAQYVLLPVWILTYDFNKAEHTFAMNGQTGKVVGKPPISRGKVAAWFGGIAGGAFLIQQLITHAILGGWF